MKTVKRALPWVLLAFLCWLAAYSWVWNARFGDRKHYLTALGSWLGDVILLGWVGDAQTIIAGGLALGAGLFVVWQARYQREIAERDAINIKVKLFSAVAANCRNCVYRAQIELLNEDFDRAERNIELALQLIATSGTTLESMAEALHFQLTCVADDIRSGRNGPKPDTPSVNRAYQMALGRAFLIDDYLKDESRLIDKGTGAVKVVPQRRERLTNTLHRLEITIEDIPYADGLYFNS